MINRRVAIGGIFGTLAAVGWAEPPTFRPLQAGAFATLVAARRGQPFLLVLWSITCGPCRDEFALLREMRNDHPIMPLVLISTDDVNDEAMAATALQGFAMRNEESWIFADDAQKLRFEIDPDWYGELPRSYFYNPNHSREGVSGRLDRARIERWIGTESPSA